MIRTIQTEHVRTLRDMERPAVLGYDLDRVTLTPIRRTVDTRASGDYGADPIGDGTFRMVPSGDVVTLEERDRRLAERPAESKRQAEGKE